MRSGNRQPDAIRAVTIERNFISHAPGSVLISFGDTRVICTATISGRVPGWLRGQGEGWITAEYAMLPGSSPERISRDAARKGRALEISRLIGRSLRAVVDRQAMGECLITLDCDVIQADGGTRTAAITGACTALHDAFEDAVRKKFLIENPMRGFAAAVSAGIVDGEILLDLCYEEDVRAGVDLNLVMNSNGEFLEVQGSAEGAPWNRAEMDAMLALGEKGIRELITLQRKAAGLE
jgi:ribonuclease PH